MPEGFERVEKLLAMILLHDMHDTSQEQKVVALNRAGFPSEAIATLLGTTRSAVNQRLYTARQTASPKRAKAGSKGKRTKKTRKAK